MSQPRALTSLRRWPLLAAGSTLAVCLGPLGCTGTVGNPPAGGAPGQAGTTGTSGAGGAAGTGAPTGGAGAGPRDIGFAPIGRLNQTQYNNTIRDLLGTQQTLADAFPADETTLGFDTISAVLRVQPEHLEKYLAAAHTLVDELFARPATDTWRMRYFTCDHKTGGAACLGTILKAFAGKAWRRPVADAELAPYLTLAAAQPTPDEGLNAGLVGVLTSTRFLYRIENDPNVDSTTPHRLTGHELATRLSYFLWSTMPDDALFAAAASGALLTDAGLKTQIDRLLADKTRARTFIDTFGAQWLSVNRMQEVTPDATMFSAFNDTIRQAMIQESKEFLWDFLTNDRPVSQMLNADFTYVNAPLATLYGLPAVPGTAMQRVSTVGTNRNGVLSQGSYLAGSSNPTRTSPVKRGLYVLDRFLCAAPPPPPATVDLNIDQGSGLENLSLRQRLAQHQMKGASCSACHTSMDAIGLGVENFDAIGRYRDKDEFGAIDASGMLPAGDGSGTLKPFNGVTQLAQILSADPRVMPCVVQKLLTFGVGRAFKAADEPLRDDLARNALAGGGSLRAALQAIGAGEVFRSRRAAAMTEVTK